MSDDPLRFKKGDRVVTRHGGSSVNAPVGVVLAVHVPACLPEMVGLTVDFGGWQGIVRCAAKHMRLTTEPDTGRAVAAPCLPEPKPEQKPCCSPELATLEMLKEVVEGWERTVRYVEADADEYLRVTEEYSNDLSWREEVLDVMSSLEPGGQVVPAELLARLEAADARFRALTHEANCIFLDRWYDPEIYWFFYRWPIPPPPGGEGKKSAR